MASDVAMQASPVAPNTPGRFPSSSSHSGSPNKASTLVTPQMVADLRPRAREEPGPARKMNEQELQQLVEKYTDAADNERQREENDFGYSTKQQDKEGMGIDGIGEYELAKAQVQKVAKSVMPGDMSLRPETVLGLIKASTVFINYLSAAAHEKTTEAGIKTLGAQHVLSAFKEMGLPEEYYTKLRREYKEKARAEQASKVAKSAEAQAADGPIDDAMDVDEDEGNEESIAVGDETLAAADKGREDDHDDEDDAEGPRDNGEDTRDDAVQD